MDHDVRYPLRVVEVLMAHDWLQIQNTTLRTGIDSNS
jgi:hypothetical protein